MKKYLYFAEICAYFLGAIGGFGWSLYAHNGPAAIGVAILAAMAFPELKKTIHNIMS